MESWDVIIVGAGLGGLGSGALLANAGKKVLVLERGAVIGGRAKSILYSGQVVDDGAHMISRAGHLESLFSDLKLEFPELMDMNNSEIYHQGRWKNPKELFTADMYKKVFSEMMNLSHEEISQLDDIPLNDWVDKISDDPGIRFLFFFLGCATSVGNRFETYSTGEMIYILREIIASGRKMSELGAVVKGGMSSLLTPFADFIQDHGGEVRLNTPVDSVEIRNGRAVGVNTEAGERVFHSQVMDMEMISADHVIVTLPLWDIFRVLDENLFPKWWVDWVNWISGKVSQAWSIIYALDEPRLHTETM